MHSPRLVLPAFLLSLAFLLASLSAKTTDPSAVDEALLDIKKVDPTIVVDLRYAGVQNIAGRALYPPEMPALVRPGVALRLVRAQNFLRSHHYGLKIWDAYRPPLVQNQLWQLLRNASYIANPTEGRGSLHTWGVAVDATLVDEKGEEVAMPTDFDVFTPDARLYYHGNDRWVNFHLKLLQTAMKRAGFYGLRTEWWHFIAYDWKKFGPIGEIKLSSQ